MDVHDLPVDGKTSTNQNLENRRESEKGKDFHRTAMKGSELKRKGEKNSSPQNAPQQGAISFRSRPFWSHNLTFSKNKNRFTFIYILSLYFSFIRLRVMRALTTDRVS